MGPLAPWSLIFTSCKTEQFGLHGLAMLHAQRLSHGAGAREPRVVAVGGTVRNWRGRAFSGRCWTCQGGPSKSETSRGLVRATPSERLRLRGGAVLLARSSRHLRGRRGWAVSAGARLFSRRWVLSVCHVRRSFKMNQTRVLPVQWGGRHSFRHPLGGMSLVAV